MAQETGTLAPLWDAALQDAIRCRVVVESEVFGDPESLSKRLENLRGRTGWICTTDAVTRWEGGMPERFLPLAGELVEDERTSWQIRQIADGWIVTRIEERPSDGGDADLAFDEDYESTAPGHERDAMRYRIYHRRDAQGVYRPLAARFMGWSGEGAE